jgi:uracil phosphoribosyltransferase
VLRSKFQLQSPIASFTGYTIPLRIGLSPILRAGISMTDGMLIRPHLVVTC